MTQSPIGGRYRQIRDVLRERAGADSGLICDESWEHYFLLKGFHVCACIMILNAVQFVKSFKII